MEKINVTNRHVFAIYWRAARRYKGSLVLIFFGVITASLMELIVPLYYKRFFDILSGAADRMRAVPLLLNTILWILGLNAVVWLGYRLSTFANSYFEAYVMSDLKQIAFDYLLGHSHDFFANSFVGSLVQKTNRLSRGFEVTADRLIWNVFPLAIRITGISIGLWFFSRPITLIMIAWAVVFIFFNYWFSSWKLKYDVQRAEADSRTTGALADAITNQSTIQLFTGLRTESKNFERVAHEQRNITRFTWDLNNVMEAVQALLVVLIEFFLFYFAIRYWGRGFLTIGTFVLIQTYLIGLVGRLWDFNRVIRDLYQSFADAKEMVEILYLPHGIQDAPIAKPLVVSRGEVRFEDVEFSFHQTRSVLKEINLTIRPGEKIALVGPSGAGKTTIVKLLFRFYDVDRGQILIDGQNIQRVTQESVRANLALVPQDPILFHRTLTENIRYGRRDATDEEVLRVAKLAHCDEFIRVLPLGYQTYVGERGIKLSGGERQRVAIARAMLKNAPLLVLDEATSSLDSHSEALIQDALDNLMRGKTVIVIAHRLSTIRKMDRIIVMEEGQIMEEGKHDELVARPGSLYAKLWTLQAGGFLLNPDESPEPSEEETSTESLELVGE